MNSHAVELHYRFCPRCGTQAEAAGNIPFKCRECDFAHFFGPVAAVGALVANEDNQLLMVRRARDPGKGKWGLPGGFVDRDESIEQALSREVLEETGLRVVAPTYLTSRPNIYDYRGIVSPVIDLFYCCRADSSEEITLADDELSGYEWARPTSKHLDNMAFYSNRLAIEYWLQQF